MTSQCRPWLAMASHGWQTLVMPNDMAMANGLGQWPWPMAMAIGHGQWPMAMAKGQWPWPKAMAMAKCRPAMDGQPKAEKSY